MIKMKQKKNQLNSLSEIPLVILAGGKGSQIQEYTKKIPKPLIKLKNKPLIEIIIDQYKRYGVKKVIVAAGYKHKLFKKHFKKQKKYVIVVNTGRNSLTGLRIKKIEKYV
jgi:NDP-sugar pyrophosphorylase family protein